MFSNTEPAETAQELMVTSGHRPVRRAKAREAEKFMSEELKPQELENDQPVAPELSEQELNEIAGGSTAGANGHGGPPPAPGG
jgi:hypothetical protein